MGFSLVRIKPRTEYVEQHKRQRYKHIETSPRFIAVDLLRQLLPRIFEHVLNHPIAHELDLSGFNARFRNDETFKFMSSPSKDLSFPTNSMLGSHNV